MSLAVHLVNAGPGAPSATTLALLAESRTATGADAERLLLLGGRALRDAAATAGIHDADHLHVPHAPDVLRYPAVLRRLRSYGRIDIAHCWSPGALRLACMTIPQSEIFWTVTRPPDEGTLRKARRRAVQVLTTSRWTGEALSANGGVAPRHKVLTPAIDPARLVGRDRAAIREPWGVTDDTLVIALLGEPQTDADAMRAVVAAGQVYEHLKNQPDRARDMRLLVHPHQRRRRVAQKAVDTFGSSWFLVQDSGLAAPWTVLNGCDAAMMLGPGGLSLLWAMSAGVPVIAEPLGATPEYAEHDQTALLARPNDHRSLADQVLRLIERPDLARTVAHNARQCCTTRTNPADYRRALAAVYRHGTTISDDARCAVPES